MVAYFFTFELGTTKFIWALNCSLFKWKMAKVKLLLFYFFNDYKLAAMKMFVKVRIYKNRRISCKQTCSYSGTFKFDDLQTNSSANIVHM